MSTSNLAEDEYELVLYSGQDYASAITQLILLADPEARVAIEPTGRDLPCKFAYLPTGLRDWWNEASECAQAIGKKLHKVADVWVLAPNICHCATD